MRYVLVALALGFVVSCKSSPSAPPANKAAAPDYQQIAADELAFLASDADFVIGVDLATLRRSRLWTAFQPQIDAFMRQAQEAFAGGCGEDYMKQLERITMAFKVLPGNEVTGVFVMRGGDAVAALDCSAKSADKTGKTATMDRGVLVLSKADNPLASASRAVGKSTMVGHLDKNASYDSVAAVLARGVPLRSSPEFLKLYDRREQGAVVWGMANGNASVFSQMAQSGLRPRSIDGTIGVTDRVTIIVRMTMGDGAQAASIAKEIEQVKAMAMSYVDRVDVRVVGPMTQVEVVVTEAQLRALAGMAGALIGS
jgi:hypothetical protein